MRYVTCVNFELVNDKISPVLKMLEETGSRVAVKRHAHAINQISDKEGLGQDHGSDR